MLRTSQLIALILLFIESDLPPKATIASGWKAVPASQAMYALRAQYYAPKDGAPLEDEDALPRTFIHSIYKFGWCTPDTIQKVFLRKTTNITLSDWASTQAPYLYLLEDEGTQRFQLQCIVMKVFVPRTHLFRRSRLPLYYCQGELFFVWKLTYQRLEIHEFYFRQSINMPSNFVFEFYHATPL